MRIAATFTTIEWRDGAVVMIDQRLLPGEERYNVYRDVAGVAEAIRTMVIRGAPAIGVAAAYGVALAARAGDVPFYVAAPWSTIDMDTPDGTAIPIEERPPEEVTHVLGTRIVPEGVPVRNPAFDVTPAHLVTAIIADRGIVRPPYDVNLAGLA